jgi:hypothetical protein
MPNPYVIVGALVLVICSYFYGHHTGVAVTKAEWEAEKAVAAADAARTLKAEQQGSGVRAPAGEHAKPSGEGLCR